VRPILIVPETKPKQLLPERGGEQRHQQAPGAFDLHGLDEAFDHGNRAVLTDGPKSRPDLFPLAPVLEGGGVKESAAFKA
jgi:hypothetical protein